ncbi:Copper chaperone CopZ [Paenimyroides ummariense]|uniref:Copper chaperone CopZ n=1 Tax=Paenimyroides ummariense TaxID=913024 RepID=A0A1I5F2C5_9FLAO|nr:cation transporter [Paenimyroides ummariense]SFO17948.1 Copper chaperone CopZ [Paenimyroides ummariense]
MKSIVKILLVVSLVLSATNTFAQMENTKKETVHISGNCGMCKTTIEQAGNVKNVAEVVWDKDSKTAVLTFDDEKTNKEEILKRIASAGYDNDKYSAHDDVYAKLPACCQYDRKSQSESQ